jgi:capsular polysaccharide transport system permease protein
LTPLRQKITAYKEQIEKQRQVIAGSNSSMATKLAAYERLILTRELEAKGLEAAVVHLTSARQDAEQQRLYLETIVTPNLSDQARHPHRILWILAILALSLSVFWIARAFIGVAMEHHA